MTRAIPKSQLDTWLMELIQGEITSEDLLKLEGAMADDLEILDYCIEYLIVTAGLEWLGKEMENQGADQLVKSLTKGRKIVPARRRGSAKVLRLATRIAAVLVLGIGLVYVTWTMMVRSQSQGLAKIVNGLSAKWESTSLPTAKGTVLNAGPLHLVEGLIDLRMADGARIVVKGPCWFSLEGSNSLKLDRGMITARVPRKAKGFTVNTRTIRIVDLGTEFGVIAKRDGTVETHVFEGKVRMVPAGKTVDSPESFSLPGGVSAIVSPGRPVQKAGASAVRFVRDIPLHATGGLAGRRFDLADVVGRGNGFGTGKIGRGVHPANGEALEQPVPPEAIDVVSGYGFLLSWRYIDGVFVPNGRLGRNAVTSDGRLFEDCPPTNGRAVLGICNGGFMALPQGKQATYAPRLNGQAYGSAEKPALGMHPNAGLTFDLDRIRADNPGVSLKSLQAICGLSESAPERLTSTVTFWVLVDGRIQYQHTCKPADTKTGAVNIPLARDARFLTLVTTCPGDTDYAWAVWAQPYLEMAED